MTVEIICPNCNGTTVDEYTGTHCRYCSGRATVSPTIALQVADNLVRRAFDDAVSGLGTIDKETTLRKAALIRETISALR